MDFWKKTTLGFKLTDCWGLAPEAPYSLRFLNSNGIEIKPHDLSAGEKAITKILLLTFIHNFKTARPKLILLDEQDAHLEPSAIDGFIESIKNTLVDKFKCHVILTTDQMDKFEDERKFAAWAGVAAGNNESGGKKKDQKPEKVTHI